MEKFTEATRVQMPALVHLTRLGYKYFGKISEDMAGIEYDPDTNILIKVFCKKFDELNHEVLTEQDKKNPKKVEQFVVEHLKQMVELTKEMAEFTLPPFSGAYYVIE